MCRLSNLQCVLSQTCRFITADLWICVSRFSGNCWPWAAVSSWLRQYWTIRLYDTHPVRTYRHVSMSCFGNALLLCCFSVLIIQRPHRADIVRTSVRLIWLLLLFTSNIREVPNITKQPDKTLRIAFSPFGASEIPCCNLILNVEPHKHKICFAFCTYQWCFKGHKPTKQARHGLIMIQSGYSACSRNERRVFNAVSSWAVQRVSHWPLWLRTVSVFVGFALCNWRIWIYRSHFGSLTPRCAIDINPEQGLFGNSDIQPRTFCPDLRLCNCVYKSCKVSRLIAVVLWPFDLSFISHVWPSLIDAEFRMVNKSRVRLIDLTQCIDFI